MQVESNNLLFESLNGRPIPLLPRTREGELRAADGRKIFSLDQAAAHFAQSVDSLREIWLATWGEYLPSEAASVMVDASEDSVPGRADVPTGAGELGPVTGAIDAGGKLALLHALQYSQLDNEQFELFAEMCRQRRLNAWCRHLFPRVEWDSENKRPNLVIITTIDAMRMLAFRSGLYEASEGPMWCGKDGQWMDVCLDLPYPSAAKFGVKRRGCPTRWGMALWDEYAPYTVSERGVKIWAPFWDRMGRHMLAKCAEALALRMAVPEELAGMYSTEETAMGIRSAGSQSRAPEGPAGPAAPPTSRRELDDAMREAGMRSPGERSAFVAAMERKYPIVAENDPGAFYELCWRTAASSPVARATV